ncbi:SusD/RagB family nutrient-binding outer membrane lipoprotein [Maribacter sp. 2210JD10-5]|uniref:SusD/RagB family nutrient-binding outer membrane lipoprotein n=1 Tax=Maribacter sp. 2210JD10-5 TaxID=3386272 RepID=UPI0039BC50E4
MKFIYTIYKKLSSLVREGWIPFRFIETGIRGGLKAHPLQSQVTTSPWLRDGAGALFVLSLLFTSCNKDFEEINTNPNQPLTVQPSLLLRQVIYDYGEQMSYEGFTAGDLLGQYRTALDFNLFDRHDLKSPQLGGNPWPILYTNLRDNEQILRLALENPTFEVYEGPARILKAYMAGALTDMFGDVPYSEGFQGKDVTVTPVYDNQEDIYLAEGGIFDNLEKGIAAIENYTGTILLEGDILFNGDLDGWLRFARSLQIKFLMRTSNVQDNASALQAIVDAGGFISENSQNAAFDFNDGEPNNFRLARLRIGDFNNFVLSETMDEILTDLNDPRIGVLFRPFSNSDSEAFNGLLNGIDATQNAAVLADFSLAGTAFRENTSALDANFMTSWETHFLLAEAAERGLITGDAQTFYEIGVTQAFEYWNTELPNDYLTGPGAYTTGNPIENIITQKWIANIINGYEGWIEYRRTGFPQLKTISASLNNDLIPVRMPYPAEEQALNAVNYEAAAAKTNGNSVDAPVWWDEAP